MKDIFKSPPKKKIATPPTVEDLADGIERQIQGQNRQILQSYNMAMSRIWNNKSYSPEEIFAALGDRGLSILQAGAEMKEFLEKRNPSKALKQKPDGVEFDVATDGTVTIVRGDA